MFDDHFKKSFGKIPFAIYFADYKPLPQGTEVLLHQHKEMELIHMTEGSVNFFVNGEAFALQEGDTLFIPPYALHRVSVLPDTATCYQCICFDLNLLYDESIRTGLEKGTLTIAPLCQLHSPDTGCFAEHISAAFYACRDKTAGWEFAVVGNLSLLFAELANRGCLIPSTVLDTNKDFCMQVMEYITQNYSEVITSRSVADYLYMNNSYFCRLFHKNFGTNFSLYLQTYRIEKAKSLLKYTQMPVSAVASAVGFSDFSYFSKIFKRDCGLSPSEYRKK